MISSSLFRAVAPSRETISLIGSACVCGLWVAREGAKARRGGGVSGAIQSSIPAKAGIHRTQNESGSREAPAFAGAQWEVGA